MKHKEQSNSNFSHAKAVKSARDKLKMTQEEFAELFGISNNYVSLIERGHRRLSQKKIEMLAEKSGLRVEYLLGLDGFQTEKDKKKQDFISSVIANDQKKEELVIEWSNSMIPVIAYLAEYDIQPIYGADENIIGYSFQDYDSHSTERIDLSREELTKPFVIDVQDYAVFRLRKIIKEKENLPIAEMVAKEKDEIKEVKEDAKEEREESK